MRRKITKIQNIFFINPKILKIILNARKCIFYGFQLIAHKFLLTLKSFLFFFALWFFRPTLNGRGERDNKNFKSNLYQFLLWKKLLSSSTFKNFLSKTLKSLRLSSKNYFRKLAKYQSIYDFFLLVFRSFPIFSLKNQTLIKFWNA